MTFSSIRQTWYSRLISLCLMITFVTTMVITPRASYAQEGVLGLPQPGTMVELSPAYVPLMITGLTIHPENPLLMDFIVSTGNSEMNVDQVKKESGRLIKYFLACLTIPENDQWVNLSPYEKQRIIPEDLGQTVLGQDMLAQDYLLKQLTASLIYPEKNLGKNFWDKVYAKAAQMYGTTQIPVDTFNKVWILPDTAKIYEHKDTVFVVKSHFKVMLDEDYLALSKNAAKAPQGNSSTHSIASQIIRQIVLPAIEQEVNRGKNFAQLRQIYNSMILAVWFKKNLKQALLNQVYTNRSKVNGVNVDDPSIKEKIYKQYLEAYRKGVFNYIKEEIDQNSQETIPRKYFSGGLVTVPARIVVPATDSELRYARDHRQLGSLAVQVLLGNAGPGRFHPAMTATVLPETEIYRGSEPALTYGKDHGGFRISLYRRFGNFLISLLLPVRSSIQKYLESDHTARLIEIAGVDEDNARAIHQKLDQDTQLWQTITTAPITTPEERDALMEKISLVINPSKHNPAMASTMKWTDVQGNIEKWLPLAQQVAVRDINLDMFRDYDYRYVRDGVALKPEIVFIQALVWAKMALKKAETAGIKTRDVLVARDARKIEPEIADAEIAALRYAGLNVVFVGDEPNCVTSYSWAVQSREWLMTIFNTASHVAQPNGVVEIKKFSIFGSEEKLILGTLLESHLVEAISPAEIKIMQSMQETQEKLSGLFPVQRVQEILKILVPDIYVRGFKVTQLGALGGNVLSLTTKEIKNESLALVKNMLEDKSGIKNMGAAQPGKLDRKSIEAEAIRFNTAVGLVAANNESLYQLGRDIKGKDANAEVQSVIDRLGANKPLAGLKVVVEGSHTPSGPLAAGVFRNLGADVEALNQDVQEISGLHNADPSIEKNLEALKKKIIDTHANFGIAFDLDGDRGAILIPEWNPDGTIKVNERGEQVFHLLSPDNLLGVLLPDLLKNWGYADSGKKVGVIRDVLGTFGVNDAAKKMGVEMFQTDAGYVYLKALKERMEAQGYVFPVYGERSGHTWLNVSGEIENPVAVAVLFATIAARYKDPSDVNGVLNFYRRSSIPYSQSPRFQPFYHPRLLQWLSDHNDRGWKYVPGVNPPQAIVALGKDETVKRLSQKFAKDTTFGEYKVTTFNTYQDPVDEGGLYRFADIMFEKNGQFVGRVVVRASSNDPTFVMSYEAPVLDGNVQEADKNRVMTSGLVMKFMADEGLGIFTRDQMREFMNYLPTDKQEIQFNKANLGPVEADINSFSNMAMKVNDIKGPVVLTKEDDDAITVGDAKIYVAPEEQLRTSGGAVILSSDRNRFGSLQLDENGRPVDGGIDLNSRSLNMESEGEKINITFNPAMVAQFRRGDFSGVKINILGVIPVDPVPMLGLKEDEGSAQIS